MYKNEQENKKTKLSNKIAIFVCAAFAVLLLFGVMGFFIGLGIYGIIVSEGDGWTIFASILAICFGVGGIIVSLAEAININITDKKQKKQTEPQSDAVHDTISVNTNTTVNYDN